jgi:exopolyphosphatase / guanosine-5'-triphosphate,3'-diphosphate pyrophosphatase
MMNEDVNLGSRTAPFRLAALDVGSNSFHLVVVEVAPDGSARVLDRAKEMVRLGESSLGEGVIPPDAFERGLHALRGLAATAHQHRPRAILAVATSAVREASNGRELVMAARQDCGLDIRIIDGAEEARLIYLGARRALALDGRRVALFDVGGGSTEAVLGDRHQALFTSSLKLGVLRLRDGWIRSDPPSAEDTTIMAEWVQTLVRPTVHRFRTAGFDFVALTSGTALALARLAGHALPAVAGIERYRLALGALHALEGRLSRMTAAERAVLPGLDPRRADTIVPGAVILRSLLAVCGVDEALVCDAALREGLVADYLATSAAASESRRAQALGNVKVKTVPRPR